MAVSDCLREEMRTRRPASAYGSGLSSTALATMKSAVLAPIPRARVITATAVKPGDLAHWRRAKRRWLVIPIGPIGREGRRR